MEGIGSNQRRRIYFVQFARWRHRGPSLPSPTASGLRYDTIRYICTCAQKL